MAANTMDENKITLNEILQKMEDGFGATAQEFKGIRAQMEMGFRAATEEIGVLTQDLQSFRADTQKEIGALTQDLQSFRADTQKEINSLTQDLQSFRLETQARFARSTSEVGAIIREIGDYLEKKILALHNRFLTFHRVALKTAHDVKESFAEQEGKLALLEQQEK